jgi:hypothetical protein
MAPGKKRKTVEWVGGLASMPAYVTNEGEPYRPEILLWMGADGALLGSAVGKPGEVLGMASASLRETIAKPAWGRPHAPARVRVASPELAAALLAGNDGIDVVCAPTPEMDGAIAAMRAHFTEEEDDDDEPSHLSPEIDAEAVAAFFRASAGLFRAKPWKIVPDDESILALSIEKLGVKEMALSVIGQSGRSFGLILFAGIGDFEIFLEAAIDRELGEEPSLPAHFALHFERGGDLHPSLRKEIAKHRWEVAAANAYPWASAIDADFVPRPATAKELTIAEAIALALPQFLKAKKELEAAWEGGQEVARTYSVLTHAGEMEVALRAPYEQEWDAASLHEEIAKLYQLELAAGEEEIDSEVRQALESALLRRFEASPEGRSIHDVQHCIFLMEFASDYFGITLALLGRPELRAILFEIIPSRVIVEPSAARAIVEDCRAFFSFLKREFGLRQADACLRLLSGDAVQRLEAALSDPGNFDLAKSLLMEEPAAIGDMDPEEDLEEWLRAEPEQPQLSLPLVGPARTPIAGDKAAARAKKKRKMARATRKKNR